MLPSKTLTVYVGNVWLKYFGSTQATCRVSGKHPVEVGLQLLVWLQLRCSLDVQSSATLVFLTAALYELSTAWRIARWAVLKAWSCAFVKEGAPVAQLLLGIMSPKVFG